MSSKLTDISLFSSLILKQEDSDVRQELGTVLSKLS